MSLIILAVYIDAFGRKRDAVTHRAIIEIYEGKHSYSATDALAMAELYKLPYKIPSLDTSSFTGLDANKHPYPSSFFVTSPNMYKIPDITEDSEDVTIRTDGRYGYGDFTLCPQWYFQGTYYLPYVSRKPSLLSDCPYAVMWYNLKETDFIHNQTSIVSGIGRIRSDLLEKLISARKQLTAKARELDSDPRFTYVQLSELRYSLQLLLFSTVALQCAPQNYTMTLLTFTGCQRHYLEALACYDFLMKYRDMEINESVKEVPVNDRLMGCLTTSVEIATEMYY
ncbi:hypothetical protein JR316_0002245 [Psilocybe cubensis]|uniref:Uncharacterized protein n=2 Tax=Psilocybe cubensis TaxID=181762 RepID=A0ACB8HCH6_PSICU|nr:hypothetical protein JR316_0002245 [Psilocybe cubensis]KAH9485337.1 hypothetical protein JR316_0002245 [Psilocybe cubensis]